MNKNKIFFLLCSLLDAPLFSVHALCISPRFGASVSDWAAASVQSLDGGTLTVESGRSESS